MDRDSENLVVEALAPLRSVARRAVGVVTFGAVTGSLAALATLAFIDAYKVLNHFLLIAPDRRAAVDSQVLLLTATLAVPTLGGLVVGLFNRYLIQGERAHGPPHVIREAQSGQGHVGLRGGLASAAASVLSLGSGASVGQYGPLVHLGSTVGSAIGRWTAPGTGIGTIGIGCGVAAAIATAFSAPIAGILFAHEVVLRHYSLKAFAPITVASALGYFVADKVFLRDPLFRVTSIPEIGGTELTLVIGLGLLGAGIAVVFMHAVLYMGRLSARSPLPDVAKPMVAGMGLGSIAIIAPEVLGMGFDTLRSALDPTGFGLGTLALVLIAKILATALCLGFGFAGGITGPALVIGALFGALAGQVMLHLMPLAVGSETLYAIVGMAAVTSAVTGAPLTTILIVFELTRHYELTTAVMVAVVFSNLVAYRLFGRSMFDVQLRRAGFDLGLGRDKVVLDRTSIGPWVSDEYIRLDPRTSCAEARAMIVSAEGEEAQVIDDRERYCGVVVLSSLDAAMDRGEGAAPISGLVVRPAVILDTHTSIWQALSRVQGFNGHAVPVLGAGGSERLAGVVPEPDLIRAYLDTVQRIRDEEHATP